MKSLKESLFDIEKNMSIRFDDLFEVLVYYHQKDSDSHRTKEDRQMEERIKKDVLQNGLKILSSNCKEVEEILYNIQKKYIKNWRGGSSTCLFYDISGQVIESNLKNVKFLDNVSKVIVRCENWGARYNTYFTSYSLIRK